MFEVEQWVIHNNENFFLKELKLNQKEQSEADLDRTIEKLKQAELELLAILESRQIETEEETS